MLYRIDFDYFEKHFPLYANGFVITDYKNIEHVAEQVSKYINSSDGEVGSFKNTFSSGNTEREIDSVSYNQLDDILDIQASLNELTRRLIKNGNKEYVENLRGAIKALEEIQKGVSKEEFKKNGVAKKLKPIIDDLGNENSAFHKTIEGIKSGVSVAQDIAEGYNKIAQWLALPQVPKPFLKKEK